MPFPQPFLEELIDRNPIEDVVGQYVTLTRRGSNLWGLCPFHSEKTPSFSVTPEKKMCYCFGCHKGGGVVNFVMEVESLSYPDAVRFLAKRAGMEVPEDGEQLSRLRRKERLWKLNRSAARFFHKTFLAPEGAPGREYAGRRGMTAKTVSHFGIGFAPEGWRSLCDAMRQEGYDEEDLLDAGLALRSKKNGSLYDRFRSRLMFPIIDVSGNIIGFGGRCMDGGEPKYLNSPETIIFNKRKNLFALNYAKKSKMGMLILTEGYMDAITLHQYGFDCAVASLGTALTEEQAILMHKYTNQVVLTYDGDEAGQNASRRAIGILEKTGLQVRVLRMRDAKDPDEYLKKFGADRFRVLLEGSENHVLYQLGSIKQRYDLQEDDQKVEFLREAAELVASLPNAVEREVYGGRAAEMAGVTPETVELEIERARKKRLGREKRKQEQRDMAPAAALQPKDRTLQYADIGSAVAEEALLCMIAAEPSLLKKTAVLTPEMFSSPLLGKAYRLFGSQYAAGQPVGIAFAGDTFTPEEMNHMAAVMSRHEEKVSEDALNDYIGRISDSSRRRTGSSLQDLRELQKQMQMKKGYGG